MLLRMSIAERLESGTQSESEGRVRALKGLKKCKFPFSGLEGKLVTGEDANRKKKNKSAKSSVCKHACYSSWEDIKQDIKLHLEDGAKSISIGLCSGTMTVPDSEYEIYVDRGVGALTNFELVCCGIVGSCIVDGSSTATPPVMSRSVPLITLGDIGEVLFQGIKFQNVNSKTTPLSTSLPRPGALISGLWPSVVALNDVSVDKISNFETSEKDETGLYFTQSLVTLNGGVYENVVSALGTIYLKRGSLFVRGVTITNNRTFNGGALALRAVKAVVRDSVLIYNTGACSVPFCSDGGGAINQVGGSLELDKNIFQNNQGTVYQAKGAAINVYNVLLVAYENVFRGNIADIGGAIYSVNGQSIFFDNLFESNEAVGSDADTSGGAITSEGTVLALVSNIFKNNVLQGTSIAGGTLPIFGTGFEGLAAAVIEGNTFESNVSAKSNAGAISINEVASVFLTCYQFVSNVAFRWGGAVNVVNSDVTSRGNIYQNNNSGELWGAVSLFSSQMTSIEDVFRLNKSRDLSNDINMYSSLLNACDVAPIVTGFTDGLYLINPDACSFFD